MDRLKATEEQMAYARLLDSGMKIGFIALLVTFAVYMSGILQPAVPLQEVSKYWGLSVHDYLVATGIQPGWAWLRLLNKGDFLNFLGIAFLAGVTVICYIRIIPILLRKNDTVYAILALVEVLVLCLAASGLLKGGGH
ncbi:MAG: hypothetical protein ACM3ON_06975 [Chloroflexota bacterium]|jgi:hypothetical protein